MDSALCFTPEGNSYEQRGRAALKHLRQAQATAVFCYNDRTAVGLMSACREEGLPVPKELAVIGFDDLELSRYVTPSLTTINQPRFKLGQTAMRMALDLLEGKEVQDQVLPCALVERDSTAAVHAIID